MTQAAEWQQALVGLATAPAHQWSYQQALQLSTGLETGLLVFETMFSRLVCPLAWRPFAESGDWVTPYGFGGWAGQLAKAEAVLFQQSVNHFLAQRGVCSYVGLNPILEDAAWFEPATYFNQGQIWLLDLRPAWLQLESQFSNNIHQRLRLWKRSGAELLQEPEALTAFLIKQYPAFARRIGSGAAYQFQADTLKAWCKQGWLIGAGRQGQVEAVSLFLSTQTCADYFLNVSVPAGREHSAALLHAAIQHLKAQQIPILNLGGGIQPGDGLAAFKARWGGVEVNTHALKQIFQQQVYQALCDGEGWEAKQEGYFPAYRRLTTSAD